MLSTRHGAPCLVGQIHYFHCICELFLWFRNTPQDIFLLHFFFLLSNNDVTFGIEDKLFSFSFFSDLVNVFEVFLPQLLLYPNPSDPLNGEAAALMMRDRNAYDQRVKGNNPYSVFAI